MQTSYDQLVGRNIPTAAPTQSATPKGAARATTGAAAEGGAGVAGGASSMRQWKESPSVWFIVLALASAYIARGAGFIRGR